MPCNNPPSECMNQGTLRFGRQRVAYLYSVDPHVRQLLSSHAQIGKLEVECSTQFTRTEADLKEAVEKRTCKVASCASLSFGVADWLPSHRSLDIE